MSTQAQYNELLIELTDKKVKEWGDNLSHLSPLIKSKDPHDMSEAQALALSYRVMILSEISYFLKELNDIQQKIKELRGIKVTYYSTGLKPDGTRPKKIHPIVGNTKVTSAQKETIIGADLSHHWRTEQILINTLDHLREYIKTIDQYMYAIKNRIELFNIFK